MGRLAAGQPESLNVPARLRLARNHALLFLLPSKSYFWYL
jgi:hypothetical protein